METESRGESEDDLMTPVDLNSNLELADLQLTSVCHGSSGIEKNKSEVTSNTICVNDTMLKDSRPSVLSSLC